MLRCLKFLGMLPYHVMVLYWYLLVALHLNRYITVRGLMICCNNYRLVKEAEYGLLKKCSHTSKRFRDTSERLRCQQPWASVNGELSKT